VVQDHRPPFLPTISRFEHCTLLRDVKRIAVSHRNINVKGFAMFLAWRPDGWAQTETAGWV